MNRFEKRLLLGLGLLIVLLATFEAMAPKPMDWSWSFSRHHKTPYGAKLFYERLPDLFPEVRPIMDPVVTTADNRLYDDEALAQPVNHVFINHHLRLDGYAAEQLLAMVAMGDHAFLAAHWFGSDLGDTLNLRVEQDFTVQDDTSDIRFVGAHRMAPGVFRFARGFPGAHFTSYDTARTRVVAVDGASRPVLLHMTWGDGRIVLCSAPLAFTNYNLLKDRNALFASAALSLLPPRPLWWDEYQKAGRTENTSFFRFLLSQPALKWALYLAELLLVLFTVVYVRRQQRPIPVIAAPVNASRELAHTIGRLYWQKADHAGIARKLIAHFKEDVRARAYLRTFAYDEDTIRHLAAKTGLDIEEMGRRLRALERIENAQHLSEQELLALSNELHDLRKRIP
ncbi:MAG: DUF4350 domain-containing protein [Flavobacteriales bacterium]